MWETDATHTLVHASMLSNPLPSNQYPPLNALTALQYPRGRTPGRQDCSCARRRPVTALLVSRYTTRNPKAAARTAAARHSCIEAHTVQGSGFIEGCRASCRSLMGKRVFAEQKINQKTITIYVGYSNLSAQPPHMDQPPLCPLLTSRCEVGVFSPPRLGYRARV